MSRAWVALAKEIECNVILKNQGKRQRRHSAWVQQADFRIIKLKNRNHIGNCQCLLVKDRTTFSSVHVGFASFRALEPRPALCSLLHYRLMSLRTFQKLKLILTAVEMLKVMVWSCCCQRL